MSIKFKNSEHEKFYEQCLARTGSLDPYHKAFFYTMGISGDTRHHIEDVYDFRDDVIRPEGLNKGWQTSGSSSFCHRSGQWMRSFRNSLSGCSGQHQQDTRRKMSYRPPQSNPRVLQYRRQSASVIPHSTSG